MSGAVHLHQKVVGSLNLGFLPTYLVFFFFLGGGLLIPNGGSTSSRLVEYLATYRHTIATYLSAEAPLSVFGTELRNISSQRKGSLPINQTTYYVFLSK